MRSEIALGVNIDHVATLRQARQTRYPDPVQAAFLAERAGADGITVHLREDRRHIQDRDIYVLKETVQTKINLEMAVTPAMIQLALDIKPQAVCLVPEKRAELTTEGGLDVVGQLSMIQSAIEPLLAQGIDVSLFIDPESNQIEAAKASGAPVIELHTGSYAQARSLGEAKTRCHLIQQAVSLAHEMGLQVNAGHGLDYHNVAKIAAIPQIRELNIGHAIVAQAIFMGMEAAVREMKARMTQARMFNENR